MENSKAELKRTVYFLRHGETTWNARGLCIGNINVPLSQSGHIQAKHAIDQIGKLPIDRIIASPLTRAKATASIISQYTGHILHVEHGFAECDFGVWQGHLEGDLSMYEDWRNGETPEGGESFLDFRTRVGRALDKSMRKKGNPLIVAHTGVYWAISDIVGQSTLSDIEHTKIYPLQILLSS